MSELPTKSIEQIFLDVVDLPRETRAQALSERCSGDVRLQLHVQRLIDADDQNASGDGAMAALEVHVPNDPVPSRVGTYVVRGVAGEGGMGAVYDAMHEPTGRRAAVKLIRAGVATASGRARMRIEAETLARLNDSGIAQLYDAGVAEVVWPDGATSRRPFIAMEFVADAASITRFARNGPLTVRGRVELIERVARAVHHAHQRGVIHRDLKPGNVLMTPDGQPKIVDFGIARLLDATVDGITVTGQVLGTVRYMSPEQASGDPRQVDTRADIYALGAILFELLTERPLFEPESGSSVTAAVQLLHATPPRLSKLKPELSGDLDEIVHKAVERDPNDRYGSAQAFAEDLSRYLDGREVSARAPSTVERFVRIVRRNKGKFAAVALIVLSLIGGVIGATWGLVHAERARRAEAKQRVIADESARTARAAEADSRAFGDFLTSRILATARPKEMQGGLGLDATIADALRVAETKLDEDFVNRPGAEALARHAIGITWRQRGDLAAAEGHFRRAIDLATRAFGADSPITLNMRNSLQVLLEQARRRPEDLSEPERILKDLENTMGPRDVRTITARYNLAIYRAKAGQLAPALALLEQVYADRKATLGEDQVITLSTISDIAEVNQLLGRTEQAFKLQHELIDKFSAKLGDDNPQTLNARYRMACLEMLSGKTQQAVESFEKVIPGLRRALGDESVTTLDAIVQLAQCCLKLQRYEQAVPLFREYVAGQGKLMGERSPQTARMMGITATQMFRAKQYPAAEEFARKHLDLQKELSPDAPPFFDAQCLLGECLAAQGSEEAITLLTAGVEGLDRQSTLSPGLEARRQSAGRALAALLDSRGHRDQADSWRARLATSRPATQPATTPR